MRKWLSRLLIGWGWKIAPKHEYVLDSSCRFDTSEIGFRGRWRVDPELREGEGEDYVVPENS